MGGWRGAAGVPEQLAFAGFRAAVPEQAGRAARVELARFAAKVVPDPRPGGCQHWVGAIGDDGYGRFQAGAGPAARTVHAHRWVWEYAHGLRPTRLRLLHDCDETGCVSLEHLRVGTQAENIAQMHRRGRGWRRHTASTDLRGPAGRARAIRAALAGGWDAAAYAAAIAAGDPFSAQLALPWPGRDPLERQLNSGPPVGSVVSAAVSSVRKPSAAAASSVAAGTASRAAGGRAS